MAASDATAIPVKNQAYRVTFPIWDADGDLVTGATGLDSEVSKDGGTFADCASEATEIATNSGIYFLDLTNTEMNADTVAIIVKTSSSGAKTTPIILYPNEAGDIDVEVAAYTSGQAPLQPTVAGRTLDVTATGAAGIDWANVENPTTALNLSGTNIDVDQVVASVTAPVTAGTVSDKTGYSLSAAGIQAIWDALTAALTTANSIGKLLVDNVNATISSRSSHTAADVWAVATRVLTAGTNIALAKGTGVTGFNDLSASQVNAEVLDVLATDTFAEVASAPAATSSLKDKIGWLFKLARNLRTTTSTTDSVYNDAGGVVDSTSTISDDGTTFTRGEYS